MKRLALVGTIVAVACGIGAGSAAAVGVGHSGWSWGQPVPQGEALRGLVFAGARGYAAGDLGTVLRTDDGGISWAAAQTGITADLAKISLISPDSAVIAGGCTARRTDNAGNTFNRLPFSYS